MDDDEKFWNEIAGQLRKIRGLTLTPEEAETAFDAAPEIPYSAEQLRLMAESIRKGEV